MTRTVEEVNAILHAGFEARDVEWKVQQAGVGSNGKVWARIVPYIDTRAIVKRLIEAFGPSGFTMAVEPILGGATKDGRRAGFLATITASWPDGQETSRCDVAEETEGRSGQDSIAMKGGVSGAYKRAAVHYGIGAYLYESPDFYAQVFEGTDGGEFRGSVKEKAADGQVRWRKYRWSLPQEALEWIEWTLAASPGPSPSRAPSSPTPASPTPSRPVATAAPATPSSPSRPASTTPTSGATLMPGRPGWFDGTAGGPITAVPDQQLYAAKAYYEGKLAEEPRSKFNGERQESVAKLRAELTRRNLPDTPAPADPVDQSPKRSFEDFPDELRDDDEPWP